MIDHEPTLLELDHPHALTGGDARMPYLSPALQGFGWGGIVLGFAAQAAAAGPLIAAVADAAAVVAVICPIGGLLCLLVNTLIRWRDSEGHRMAARAKAWREGHAAGKAEILKSFGLEPDGRVFRDRDRDSIERKSSKR